MVPRAGFEPAIFGTKTQNAGPDYTNAATLPHIYVATSKAVK